MDHGSQGLGPEPSKDLIRTLRTNIRFCKDHRNSKEHNKSAEFHMPRLKHSVCPAYLLKPTPGMHYHLAGGLGTNIFSASFAVSSGSCAVQTVQPNG